jgi:hypothetical protein
LLEIVGGLPIVGLAEKKPSGIELGLKLVTGSGNHGLWRLNSGEVISVTGHSTGIHEFFLSFCFLFSK